MTEISDEFKVIIVDAIRSLCLKFPAKHASMLTFLSSVLRDEGDYEFKRAVVEAMFDMIKLIPESKEQALSHLCELSKIASLQNSLFASFTCWESKEPNRHNLRNTSDSFTTVWC